MYIKSGAVAMFQIVANTVQQNEKIGYRIGHSFNETSITIKSQRIRLDQETVSQELDGDEEEEDAFCAAQRAKLTIGVAKSNGPMHRAKPRGS